MIQITASQVQTTDVQFARYTNGENHHFFVQNVEFHITNGTANGYYCALRFLSYKIA